MEKYYSLLGAKQSDSMKMLKKKYLSLMKKTHPDKGNDDEVCKEINEAYQKILEFKLNGFCDDNDNLPLVPKKFKEMGFDKIPTVHEYVRELIKIQCNSLNDYDDENPEKIEKAEVFDLENVKKKSIFEKIFYFFFEDDSDSDSDSDSD